MNKPSLPSFFCLLALVLLPGPTFLVAQPPEPDFQRLAITASRHWLDIDYVGDGTIAHQMDIHLPAEERTRYPVVICIYGSAWYASNAKRNVFREGLGQFLLANGFAVVSINHRSSREAIFPAQLHDVKAAIRFVRANAAAFALDTTFVGVTGWSSGGHLSAMAGATSRTAKYTLNGETIDLEGKLGPFTGVSSAVDAVVDWFGPTDFLIMNDCGSAMDHDAPASPESSLIGGAIQDHPVACRLANPITYVSASTPPFLIFHGELDPLVPLCQSERLHEALLSVGGRSELHPVTGGGHGPGVMIPDNYERMVRFLREQVAAK
jgi:acetyl esterase/lipase